MAIWKRLPIKEIIFSLKGLPGDLFHFNGQCSIGDGTPIDIYFLDQELDFLKESCKLGSTYQHIKQVTIRSRTGHYIHSLLNIISNLVFIH